mmetsp:Transcript_6542/g.9872  ORF Transcript_6542/g.9872 Transcript_6542/m.9872 type:complete len:139 (-) Transcript_6542:343-759(-)
MELHQFNKVKLGLSEDLNLANAYVLQREDGLASLLNFQSNRFRHRDKFLDKLLEIALGGLLSHDVEHLSADSADLARLCVTGGLCLLVALLLGEANAEKAEVVSIRGADVNKSLNKGLPFSDKGAEFVTGDVHAVEVG